MADIILTKSDATTDVTYAQQQNQGSVKIYANLAAGQVEPEQLSIQHFLRPLAAKGTDRHLIIYRKIVIEDATSQALQLQASLQLSVPRSADITLAMVKNAMAQLITYIGKGSNIESLMNGGTPEGDFNVSSFVPNPA